MKRGGGRGDGGFKRRYNGNRGPLKLGVIGSASMGTGEQEKKRGGGWEGSKASKTKQHLDQATIITQGNREMFGKEVASRRR